MSKSLSFAFGNFSLQCAATFLLLCSSGMLPGQVATQPAPNDPELFAIALQLINAIDAQIETHKDPAEQKAMHTAFLRELNLTELDYTMLLKEAGQLKAASGSITQPSSKQMYSAAMRQRLSVVLSPVGWNHLLLFISGPVRQATSVVPSH